MARRITITNGYQCPRCDQSRDLGEIFECAERDCELDGCRVLSHGLVQVGHEPETPADPGPDEPVADDGGDAEDAEDGGHAE